MPLSIIVSENCITVNCSCAVTLVYNVSKLPNIDRLLEGQSYWSTARPFAIRAERCSRTSEGRDTENRSQNPAWFSEAWFPDQLLHLTRMLQPLAKPSALRSYLWTAWQSRDTKNLCNSLSIVWKTPTMCPSPSSTSNLAPTLRNSTVISISYVYSVYATEIPLGQHI